jgi:hypothetical protein
LVYEKVLVTFVFHRQLRVFAHFASNNSKVKLL